VLFTTLGWLIFFSGVMVDSTHGWEKVADGVAA